MKITNTSKNTLLTDDAYEAMSFFDKSLGLMNKKKPKSLILKTRFGIHTFGLKEQIDVLILNKQNKVVALKHSLHPSRLFTWNIKYSTVIELPAGTLLATRTEKGDLIEIADKL